MDTWTLANQTHALIKQKKWEVAILPFGATEPHNLHMPYGTDTFQVERMGQLACQKAAEQGASVLLLPVMPFGVNTNHLQIPGAMTLSVNPTTLLKLIEDLSDSLQRQGCRKLLLLNGHGGNELKPLMRELHHRTKMFMCLCDWYRMAADEYAKIFRRPAEHADEVETSLGLAFFPELVHMEQAGSGYAKPSRLNGIRQGWVSVTRPWHLVTADTGIGDPSAATAEKGRELMEVVVDRLSQIICELSASPLDATFPY